MDDDDDVDDDNIVVTPASPKYRICTLLRS